MRGLKGSRAMLGLPIRKIFYLNPCAPKGGVGIILIALVCLIIYETESPLKDNIIHAYPKLQFSARAEQTSFDQALGERKQDGTVVLVCIDSGYVEMGPNLYETCFRKHGISNYLFVGIDLKVCGLLKPYGINCVTYSAVYSDIGKLSDWGSEDFNAKTFFKIRAVLDALKLGLDVLLTDVDVVMFANPLPSFTCFTCDIEIMDDILSINSGFYYSRPTKTAIEFHKKALEMGKKNKNLNDQQCLNETMTGMQKTNSIKIKILSKERFPNGFLYFENGKRRFAEEAPACPSCVMVHNNWMLTGEAKVYRFKENGLWTIDTDGYYSSSTRKYISYDNPLEWDPKETKQAEKEALQAALYIGRLLNRVVILPKFHCPCSNKKCTGVSGEFCPLNSLYSIAVLDKHVKHQYREHSFFKHPLVPISIKRSLSKNILIKSQATEPKRKEGLLNLADHLLECTPQNTTLGPSREELVAWLSPFHEYSVLRFHSLYGLFRYVTEDVSNITGAFHESTYRQLKNEIVLHV